MDTVAVVICFLREGGALHLGRRPETGRWDAVRDRVRDREPAAAARTAVREATGLGDEAVVLVRAGEPFPVDDVPVEDDAADRRWLVQPFLFDATTRTVESAAGFDAVEWVPAPTILERETTPELWTAYDRVRPRVATVADDREHGSASLSVRALETLRDEAALAAAGRHEHGETAERDGDDPAALAALARRLREARPSMVVVANRVNRAMAGAAAGEDGTGAAPAPPGATAVRRAVDRGIERVLAADREAASVAAAELPETVATLSRSGTVLAALREREPAAVLVAESRPGREGVGVAESLAEGAAVTLTTDAALAGELDRRGIGALVVGADRVLPDGRVLNKVGTRGGALSAPADCRVFVVAARDKVAPDAAVDREERDPGVVYDGDADLAVANPTFDVTPAEAVDAVLTEVGPLSAEDVRDLAAEHRRLARRCDRIAGR